MSTTFCTTIRLSFCLISITIGKLFSIWFALFVDRDNIGITYVLSRYHLVSISMQETFSCSEPVTFLVLLVPQLTKYTLTLLRYSWIAFTD